MDEEALKSAMREMGRPGGKSRAEALSAERLAEKGRKAGIKSGKARRKKAAAKSAEVRTKKPAAKKKSAPKKKAK